MFFVQLRFAANKAAAPQFMEAHNAWISEGFADGVFLMTGSLAPGIGGAVLAHNTTREALEARVAADPFVGEGIVSAEISEIKPGRVDDRLAFLTA
ncbi:hypothetical protein HHI_15648 [Hyphomonas hirschiana VP5]|uniref:YCII-related domain-containing protein n=1 Tax=Hyphomonas hirschiana VP5 TaxID=1280951 RepID=A0A059FBA8_9PROT|nr:MULTISPECIES: YciI family protein [Hyphomonas]KCZ87899.1 hypothetical protein HHI_15648 [Hyphomonas hirschiana VP5]